MYDLLKLEEKQMAGLVGWHQAKASKDALPYDGRLSLEFSVHKQWNLQWYFQLRAVLLTQVL